MQVQILGIPVTFLRQKDVLTMVKDQSGHSQKNHPYFVVTANPEFLLHARRTPHFQQALLAADLILPDGVALAQARYFLENHPTTLWQKLLLAMSICGKTLRGDFAQDTVTGVSLVKRVLADQTLSVFLLGGFDGVAETVGKAYKRPYYEGPQRIMHADETAQAEIFKKIAAVKPDVLLVAFGHFKQETWIHEHLSQLDCHVVIGVGSTFDEIAGRGYWAKAVPPLMARMGLKWLWRLLHDRAHFKRVWQAVIVFPWIVAFGE